MSLVFGNDSLRPDGPSMVVILEPGNDKIVEIFGEIHGDHSNDFYEDLISNPTLLEGKQVWTEHATVFCDLAPEDEPLFEKATGSDYIWFKLAHASEPSICIDTRLENGFPSAVKERLLAKMIQTDEIYNPEFMMMMYKLVQEVVLSASRLKGLFTGNPVLKGYFNDFASAIQRQTQIALKMISRGFEGYTLRKGVPNKDIYYTIVRNLQQNLQRFSALTVDAELFKRINDLPPGSHVLLFTGLGHAVRLSSLFEGQQFSTLSPEKEEQLIQSSLFPDANTNLEKQFLATLSE